MIAKRLISAAGLSMLLAFRVVVGSAAEPEQGPFSSIEQQGQRLYRSTCLYCHDSAPGNPGTYVLAKKLGKESSVLENRTDITADYVTSVTRHGLKGMPKYRKTELSDADVMAIAAYLTRQRSSSAKPSN
jgi:mono/diheme cytochrome c family protein